MTLKELDHWHKTRTGYAVFGVAELALAYVFASLAIDNGSLWFYLITFVLGYGGLQNLVKTIWIRHESSRPKAAKAR